MGSKINNTLSGCNLSFYKLAWVFIVGSLIGTWYEEIITFVKFGMYENRSAVFLGPFNPLYGVGFLVAVAVLIHIKNPFYAIFVGSLMFGLFEYYASVLQEVFTGSVSWDYHHLPLNIHGRTTIIYAFFWGLFAFLMVRFTYPILANLVDKAPKQKIQVITKIFVVFLFINMLITYSALIRQGMRVRGIEAKTPIGEVYDRIFTDDYIQEKFPNMVLVEGDTDE